MLPADTKQRREATLKKALQSSLTNHFKPVDATRCIPYSDKGFLSVAIEWLVNADLVSCLTFIFWEWYWFVVAILATYHIQSTILQEDGRSLILFQLWHQTTSSQANTCRSHQDVHTLDASIEGSPQCKYWFTSRFNICLTHLTEPCCYWENQPDMWRMAGWQYWRLFCSDRPLDWGAHRRGVDWGAHAPRFHSAQHGSQWNKTWTGFISGMQPS